MPSRAPGNISSRSPSFSSPPQSTVYDDASPNQRSDYTSSPDTSIADVESGRARFVRLTAEFQRIHEGLPVVGEQQANLKRRDTLDVKDDVGNLVGARVMSMQHSPIELSDEGSDDSFGSDSEGQHPSPKEYNHRSPQTQSQNQLQQSQAQPLLSRTLLTNGNGNSSSSTTNSNSYSNSKPRPSASVPASIKSSSKSLKTSQSHSQQVPVPVPSMNPNARGSTSTVSMYGEDGDTMHTHTMTHGSVEHAERIVINGRVYAHMSDAPRSPSSSANMSQSQAQSQRPREVSMSSELSFGEFGSPASVGRNGNTKANGNGNGSTNGKRLSAKSAPAPGTTTGKVKTKPSPLNLMKNLKLNISSNSLPPPSAPPTTPLPSVPSHMQQQQGQGHGRGQSRALPSPPEEMELEMEQQEEEERRAREDRQRERQRQMEALLRASDANADALSTRTNPVARRRTVRDTDLVLPRNNTTIGPSSYANAGANVNGGNELDLERLGGGDLRSLKSTRKKRRLSDLSTWASEAPLPVAIQAPPIPKTPTPAGTFTPGAYSTKSGATTVRPVGEIVAPGREGGMWEDVEFSLRSIVNPKVFRDFVRDPLGRHRFREYMLSEGDASDLDMWLDLSYHSRQMETVKGNAQAVYDLYLSGSAQNHVQLPSELSQELLRTLRPYLSIGGIGFETTQQHLLEKMYNNSFQRYMKFKIIQECKVQLGKHNLPLGEQEGLGDCFCLTNPRLPDHPIVLVTDAFVAVTGYPRQEVVGRNCRFLQGPATAPAAIQRIRDGLNSGEGCTELLLNYRRNGEPFYCLLCVIPLRDASGAIAYFIGGQTNVTGILTSNKNLGFLLGAGAAVNKDGIETKPPVKTTMSPVMSRYKEENSRNNRDGATGSHSTRDRRRHAAGSQLQHDESGAPLGRPASINDFEPQRQAATTLSPSGSGRSLLGRFFKKSSGGISTTSNPPLGPVQERETAMKQLLVGAEATLNGPARTLEDQIAIFKDLYHQVVIFKKERREITFVTKQLLTFLGLPRVTKRDLYCSALIHADLLAILTGHDKAQTRQIRTEVKRAIVRDEALSIPCGFKFLGKGKLAGGPKHKFGLLHMTPLKDLDNTVVAFVGIFS